MGNSNTPYANNIGQDSSASVISTWAMIEPRSAFSRDRIALKNDSNIIKEEDPLNVFNQERNKKCSTGDNNLVYPIHIKVDDHNHTTTRITQICEKQLRQEEDNLCSAVQHRQLNLSLLSKTNNQVFGHYQKENKSITRKIQESKKRLEILRLQNTFILNSDILTGNRISSSRINNRKRSWSQQQQMQCTFEPYIRRNVMQ